MPFLKTNKQKPLNKNTPEAWGREGELSLIFAKGYDGVTLALCLSISAHWKEIRCFLLLVLFGSIPVLCREASGKCAVQLMCLCIVWILAEIAYVLGNPPSLIRLPHQLLVGEIEQSCSLVLGSTVRKTLEMILAFVALSVCLGDCFFLREETAVGTLVCFPVACVAFSEKKKKKTTLGSVCYSWMEISPSLCSEYFPPFTLLPCAICITECNPIIALCSCIFCLRTMGQSWGFIWQPVIVVSAAFPVKLLRSLVLGLPTLSQMCLLSSCRHPSCGERGDCVSVSAGRSCSARRGSGWRWAGILQDEKFHMKVE